MLWLIITKYVNFCGVCRIRLWEAIVGFDEWQKSNAAPCPAATDSKPNWEMTIYSTQTYRNQNHGGWSIWFLICAVIVTIFWSRVELDHLAAIRIRRDSKYLAGRSCRTCINFNQLN